MPRLTGPLPPNPLRQVVFDVFTRMVFVAVLIATVATLYSIGPAAAMHQLGNDVVAIERFVGQASRL